tara:strand:- start:3305 stop:3442 length:138 start_codon:yes stop_codon:yes gene_type:complete
LTTAPNGSSATLGWKMFSFIKRRHHPFLFLLLKTDFPNLEIGRLR